MGVLVVCHGNICRSPLATAVMRRAGLTDVVTGGFKGVSHDGAKPPKKMRDWAAANESIDLSDHKSKTVTPEMLEAAELILYMDSGQAKRLEAMWAEAGLDKKRGPIYPIMRPLAAWLITPGTKIGDPNFQKPGTAEFETICSQLVEASTNFARFWKERAAGDAEVAKLRAEAVASTDGGAGDAAEATA